MSCWNQLRGPVSHSFWNCNDYAYCAVQMYVNDLRKYNNRYYEIKKYRGLTSNSCQVGGGPTAYSFGTCPLYFAWIFQSYLMPSHFIGMLFLGPCILLYFSLGSSLAFLLYIRIIVLTLDHFIFICHFVSYLCFFQKLLSFLQFSIL